MHCLEYGTSQSGYKPLCYLLGWARQAWKQCGLLPGYLFQVHACVTLKCRGLTSLRWGLRSSRWNACMYWARHELTALDLVCQQAIELFPDTIIWGGRKGIHKSEKRSCPSWPYILLMWPVFSQRAVRMEGRYKVCSLLAVISRLVPGEWLRKALSFRMSGIVVSTCIC